MPPLQSDCETTPHLALASKLRKQAIEMNKRRRVTFDDKILMKAIPMIPDGCRNNVWMTKDDFARIRRECAECIVQAFVDGRNCSVVDLRGLETSASDQNFVRSYVLRKESIAAVLEEQKFQRQTGYNYPEDIAVAYKEVSAQSIAHAVLVAERDEIAAREADSTQIHPSHHPVLNQLTRLLEEPGNQKVSRRQL
jgi:hypothetical protein